MPWRRKSVTSYHLAERGALDRSCRRKSPRGEPMAQLLIAYSMRVLCAPLVVAL